MNKTELDGFFEKIAVSIEMITKAVNSRAAKIPAPENALAAIKADTTGIVSKTNKQVNNIDSIRYNKAMDMRQTDLAGSNKLRAESTALKSYSKGLVDYKNTPDSIKKFPMLGENGQTRLDKLRALAQKNRSNF